MFPFDDVIMKRIIRNSSLGTYFAVKWMQRNLTNDNSILAQVMVWCRQAGILFIGHLGTNFNAFFLMEIHTLSFKKIHLKVSSGKWRPFCLGLDVSREDQQRRNRRICLFFEAWWRMHTSVKCKQQYKYISGTKPLPETIQNYCHFDPYGHISMKFETTLKIHVS